MSIPVTAQRPFTSPTSPQLPPSALLGRLKAQLQDRLANCYAHVIPTTSVARAVEQAAALACSTDFPYLFFPILAEEAVHAVAIAALLDLLPFKCAEPWQTPHPRLPL
jgi:hypothetical protein